MEKSFFSVLGSIYEVSTGITVLKPIGILTKACLIHLDLRKLCQSAFHVTFNRVACNM